MTNIKALADKVEALEGPDREVDAEIVKALFPNAVIEPYCADMDVPVVFHAEPLVSNKGDLPTFTASLDAAMTLVPSNCLFDARTLWDGEKTGGHAEVTSYREVDGERFWGMNYGATAPTPALALVAACLRAKGDEG